MAVNRGGVAFWVGCIRSHRGRQAFSKHSWKFSQAVDWQSVTGTRSLSSASWALVAPNSLRYQNIKQRALSHPFRSASQTQTGGYCRDDWEESLGVCVVVRQDESDGLHTLLEIPLFGHNKLSELLAPGSDRDLSFLLTTVDGRREDDISVERSGVGTREHGCFRSLFEAERCPAPFTQGSQFYCFHCPDSEQGPGSGRTAGQGFGLDSGAAELPPLHHTSLCSRALGESKDDGDGEEKLALMYERLRLELPSFLMKNHDYTMYSNDVEFINGLMNTKTRGRVIYRLTLSVGRFLCQCYYAKAQLEVLKLTKHMEDGTIQARWRIWGLPFHSLLLRFYRRDKSLLFRSYDAFSTFYIGQDGLIHCHKVEKVMPAQPPVLPGVTSLLAGALVALGVQEHRPALNLLPLLLSSLRQSRN